MLFQAPIVTMAPHALGFFVVVRTTGKFCDQKGVGLMPPPAPSVRPQSLCTMCGTSIKPGGKYCSACANTLAAEQMVKVAPSGWVATQSANAQALRGDTQRRHAAAKRAWDPASHPSWLNEKTYRKQVLPLLMGHSTSGIATALCHVGLRSTRP